MRVLLALLLLRSVHSAAADVDAASGAASVVPSAENDGADVNACTSVRTKRSLTPDYIVHHESTACVDANAPRAVRGTSLAYVTPWHARGKELAVNYTSRFTHIAPVWFQVRAADTHSPGKKPAPVITGAHDIDAAWLSSLRKSCAAGTGHVDAGCPLIVPRITWEWHDVDTAASKEGVAAVVQLVEALVDEHGFDGVVWEAPLAPFMVKSLIPALTTALHADHHVIVVVLPAQGVPHDVVRALAGFSGRKKSNAEAGGGVDLFSVMTYDHASHTGRVGPNAPLPWARSALESLVGHDEATATAVRSRLLLGIPFYGYDERDAIVGPRVTEILRTHSADIRVKVDAKAAEHFWSYWPGDVPRRTVYYPTPWSVTQRVALGNEWGGVAIWELGQAQPWLLSAL